MEDQTLESRAEQLAIDWQNGNHKAVLRAVTSMSSTRAACVVGFMVLNFLERDRAEDFVTTLNRRLT